MHRMVYDSDKDSEILRNMRKLIETKRHIENRGGNKENRRMTEREREKESGRKDIYQGVVCLDLATRASLH